MAGLTADQDRQFRSEMAELLTSDRVGDFAAGSVAALDIDPKKLFCERWDDVKAALEFLKPYLPIWLQPIVSILIKAGDVLHRIICGG